MNDGKQARIEVTVIITPFQWFNHYFLGGWFLTLLGYQYGTTFLDLVLWRIYDFRLITSS